MPTHSSILAWRTPQTEEPGRPQSWGCKESDMTQRLWFSPLQKNLVNWHEHPTLDEWSVKCVHGYHYYYSLGLVLTFRYPLLLASRRDYEPEVLGRVLGAVRGVARSQTRLSDFPFTFHFHALEKEMATHSSVLAWRIPGTEEPGGLPSMGLHRVGHDWSDLALALALNSFTSREHSPSQGSWGLTMIGIKILLISNWILPPVNSVLWSFIKDL